MNGRTCSVPGCTNPFRAKGLCVTHYNRLNDHQAKPQPTTCAVCGSAIKRNVHNGRAHTCSVECRTIIQHGGVTAATGAGYDWGRHAMARARKAGAKVIEWFDRIDVFERDDHRCLVCGDVVDVTLPPFHPMSATIDHVIPLSRGGEHTMTNAATCHLRCNAQKSDTIATG